MKQPLSPYIILKKHITYITACTDPGTLLNLAPITTRDPHYTSITDSHIPHCEGDSPRKSICPPKLKQRYAYCFVPRGTITFQRFPETLPAVCSTIIS